MLLPFIFNQDYGSRQGPRDGGCKVRAGTQHQQAVGKSVR